MPGQLAFKHAALPAAVGAALGSAAAFFLASTADVLPLIAFVGGGLVGSYAGWRRYQRASAVRTRRRWGAFSVRSMLLMSALIAAAFGIFTREVRNARMRAELCAMAQWYGHESNSVGDYAYRYRFYSPALFRVIRSYGYQRYSMRLRSVHLWPMSSAQVQHARELARRIPETPQVFTYEDWMAERARREAAVQVPAAAKEAG